MDDTTLKNIKQKRDEYIKELQKLIEKEKKLQMQMQELNKEIFKIKNYAEALTLLLPEELREDFIN